MSFGCAFGELLLIIAGLMPFSRPTPIRFGTFEVDAHAGELRHKGVLVKLQPQPLKVLALLASHPRELITRQEIQRQIWGNETHVDFEVALNYCIKQIRSALDDDAGTPKYVETLPRRGYRFIASLASHDDGQAAPRMMLAVLPFGNLTGDSEQEYFADGMTEELITQLGHVNAQKLGVIAFTSAKQYKETSKGIDQIGKELHVDYIIEGSIRRAGDRVRITAQLIQVSDQCHLWVEAYNRMVGDIIAIQTDVAARVARSLMLELLPSHQAGLNRSSTRDTVAYEDYLKGRYCWNRRTEEAFWKALKYFKSAIDRAPDYAPAYVGLADVYHITAFYSGIPPVRAYEKSQAAISKALKIDGGFAEAYTSMAYGKLLYEWDFAGAEKAFMHALELNPNHVTGHYWYALFLAAMERFDEAFVQIELAMELDPLSLVVHCHKAWILYFGRRYPEAIKQLLNAIEMDEDFGLARYFLGLVYLQTQEHANAAAQFSKARQLLNDHPAPLSGVAVAAALSGNKRLALEIIKKLEDVSKQGYATPYYMAVVQLGIGNTSEAFAYLEKACEERSAYMSNLKADPALDSLRTHRRFSKLLRRVGLQSPS
jgi:TolB-like protein/Flp pilus assembly protein TadD